MSQFTRRSLIVGAVATPAALALATTADAATSAARIDQSANAALANLYASQPRFRELEVAARSMLVFPRITSAGFVVGGRGGDGVLRSHGRSSAYYNISAGSIGLQAGIQVFSYVMYLMTQRALDQLDDNAGWTLGAGPTLVVADAGFAANMDTRTLTQDVYATTFGQQGLMAGVSLEGARIRRIRPS